jgi:hypothetical protein
MVGASSSFLTKNSDYLLNPVIFTAEYEWQVSVKIG